ncbi:histone-lysine N-methyltransferase SETMAR-like [Mya arenaria]|uniref:histone-lysine N-methyltransferase SETMAR-like n=1 Tax=Mya arenaria TaxID=6604 RepID=UPI0022E98592|nr:histone-lysine N-methyltransferase SETMAR-like [Mya arenaria]
MLNRQTAILMPIVRYHRAASPPISDRYAARLLHLQEGQEQKCCRILVFKWRERFRDGRETLEDDERTGRPHIVHDGAKERIVKMLDCDRRVTEREISNEVDASLKTVSRIIREVHALRKKRPGLDLSRVILHQDNAPAHKANSTLLEISLLAFETLVHPPYSPDLAPMDFRVFPEVKRQLRGHRYDDVNELKIGAQRIVGSFPEDWYMETYDKWISRHRKSVQLNGDYVEK